MPTRHRSALLSALLVRSPSSPPPPRRNSAARSADRSAAVLPRRQDEGRAAEAEAQPMHRAVSQDRFFHRPSRRGAAIPRAHQGILSAAARMGAGVIECDVTFTKDRQLVCRHSQCDLHTTTNILSLPALAAKCTHAVHSGRSRHRAQGIRKVLHQRHHAGRIQDVVGQDGRLQSERHHRGRVPERHAALAHRPLQPFRHADDPRREHRADQESWRQIHARN